MDFVKLAAALAIPTVIGWLLLDVCFAARESFTRSERLSFSLGLGFGAVTLVLLVLSFLGIHFDPRAISAGLLLPLGILRLRTGTLRAPTLPPQPATPAPSAATLLRIVLVTATTASLLVVLARTMLVEIHHWDSWAMWAYKAKIFWVHRIVPVDRFTEFETTYGHWDYPQHVPLMQTWILLFLGEWNDQLPRVLFPLFYTALCVNVYAFLRRYAATEAALLGAFAFATLSGLQKWVIGTITEPMLIYYFVGSVTLLWRWMHERNDRLLVLSGIFAGLSGWTKNDGLALYLSGLVALSAFLVREMRGEGRRAAAAWLRFALCGALVVLPWSAFTRLAGIENDVVNAANLTPATTWGRLHRLGDLPGVFLHHFADVGHWNVLWPLFLVVLIIRAKATIGGPLRYLLLAILVQVAVYAGLYVIWPHESESEEYLYDTLQRLLLGPASIALLYVVLALFAAEPGTRWAGRPQT